jgi:amino acid transporter
MSGTRVEAATQTPGASADDERLRELGYEPALKRGWSSFSNFAISFTIISVLAGCFTTYGQAWNFGGPIAISIGWPLIGILTLFVALSMAELGSAFPTAGGVYYWALRLGGRGWGWLTGWFNFVGLIAGGASVNYAAAAFLNTLLGLYGVSVAGLDFTEATGQAFLTNTFVLFLLITLLHVLINVYSSPLVALFNRISVWWHVGGVVVIVAILILVPDQHQSADFVFTERINNSGFSDGMYWFYVLPVGFLLTMYTITGYDASAHVSEETQDAANSVPRGIYRSVLYAGLIGWVVLLAITFAATDVNAVNEGGGTTLAIFESALTSAAAKAVILIATIGQLFCGMAIMTSASRMGYAFARDGALPGSRIWTRINHHSVPAYAVVLVAVSGTILTIPALWGNAAGLPVAFFAVVSVAVIALYIAYTLPVFLRWRMRDAFQVGPWNLGQRYRWINLIAIGWVALSVVIFCLPFTPSAIPFNENFDWSALNYAPFVTGAMLLIVGAWWFLGARTSFRGAPEKLAEPTDS